MRKRSGYREVDGKRIWSTKVTIVDQERYDGGPFEFGSSYESGSLNRVIDSLLAIKEQIPAEYRDIARCEISSSGGYEGSHFASIEVNYERPETPDETVDRERQEQATILDAERKQRATYEALKAKFG